MVTGLYTKLRGKISSLEKGDPLSYYKCQWENKSEEVSIGFLAYKWVHFIVLATLLLLSLFLEVRNYIVRWPIYFTNWSLLLNLIQAFFGVFIVTKSYSRVRKRKPFLQSVRLLRTYGALQSTAIVGAFGVTIVYWCFLHDPLFLGMSILNITSHLFNSVVMLVDLFIVAHPVKLVDIIFPLLFVLIFVVFSIIYYFCGGTGRPYIYKILNWRRPVEAIYFIIGGSLLTIFLFVFVWLLSVLRRLISHRIEARQEFVPQEPPIN